MSYIIKINPSVSLLRKSNKVSGFISQDARFPCFVRGALAESRQLPEKQRSQGWREGHYRSGALLAKLKFPRRIN
jgi:hypothetical protein